MGKGPFEGPGDFFSGGVWENAAERTNKPNTKTPRMGFFKIVPPSLLAHTKMRAKRFALVRDLAMQCISACSMLGLT
jgi:hypothetical protein